MAEIIEMLTLRTYSKLLVGAVLILIYYGALVKSHEAGLAVPDWPTSFGENMFLFHPSKWNGIIYYEHLHRLIASVIGALTLILALWMWVVEKRKTVTHLGFVALAAVIAQGVLGGLTVIYLLPAAISVSHGVLAQTFFCLTIIIAYAHSREWSERAEVVVNEPTRKLFRYGVFVTAAVWIQLIFGAVMRHLEAGLAVLDFPTMAGSYLPGFDSNMLSQINSDRETLFLLPVNMQQVAVHILHRGGALFVLLVSLLLFAQAYKSWGKLGQAVRRSVIVYGALLIVQISLGILTIYSVREPVLTSLHVVFGAALLGSTVMLCVRCYGKKTVRHISPPPLAKPLPA